MRKEIDRKKLKKAFEEAAKIRREGEIDAKTYRDVLEILANIGGRTLK